MSSSRSWSMSEKHLHCPRQHQISHVLDFRQNAVQFKECQLAHLKSQLHECQSQLHQAQLQIQSQNERESILQSQLHQCQSELQLQIQARWAAIQTAVKDREEELSVLVQKHKGKTQEEFRDALRLREAELLEQWHKREEQMRTMLLTELEKQKQTFEAREGDLKRREIAVTHVEELLKETARSMDRKVSDIALRLFHMPKVTLGPTEMQGVVLTATGEELATPSPADLARRFDLKGPVPLRQYVSQDGGEENQMVEGIRRKQKGTQFRAKRPGPAELSRLKKITPITETSKLQALPLKKTKNKTASIRDQLDTSAT
ncbi:hypothetical protein B0H10DRAFT_1960737 [Mycena sp. CBHHK59/15]|nr:hypothetical protein B0H10DRAFT_1960737 [Mycena sp. CBHHK59/15]